MRDSKRIHVILEKLRKYWEANPDLRLGQIVSNIGSSAGYGNDPFYMEDDEALSVLDGLNAEIGIAVIEDGGIVVDMDGVRREFSSPDDAASFIVHVHPVFDKDNILDFIMTREPQKRIL